MAKEKKKRGLLPKFFGKVTNFLNHGEDLQEVAAKYEHTFEKYKQLLEAATCDAVALYNLRKEAYYTLLRFQTYVNALPGCPALIINGASLAVRKSASIKEAMDEEAQAKLKPNSTSINGGILGAAVAGSAFAIGGPSALMAIATTFGTAATGTAISSLSGVAATNAALAWIGGGALAAGGTGMSGGATVLGLMGPIGWGIAGISAIAFITLSASQGKKNQETIAELASEILKINIFMGDLKVARNSIRTIHDFTERHLAELKVFLDNASSDSTFSNDYSSDSYPHEKLFTLTNSAKNLGKMSNQSVKIKQ